MNGVHVHEWERGAHMAAAFGIDGRRSACAVCGTPKPPPERRPDHTADDRPGMDVLARALHHENCKLRTSGSRQCRFWEPHRRSAAAMLAALHDDGWRLTLIAPVTRVPA